MAMNDKDEHPQNDFDGMDIIGSKNVIDNSDEHL
jgi:hypothetical protein